MNYSDLNHFEKIKYDVIEQLHECPWYKRFKNRLFKDFTIEEDPSSGIGVIITMRCNYCGKEYDITDYTT